MKVDYPGLLKEPLPSGNHRYRVRVEGEKRKRITLSIGPDHPEFAEHYYAARRGVKLKDAAPVEAEKEFTFGWLTRKFEEHMKEMVGSNRLSPLTLKQRAHSLKLARQRHGSKSMAMRTINVINMRDRLSATPGAADNVVKALKAMYVWAMQRGYVLENPAAGVSKINPGGNESKAWTAKNLRQFRDVHPVGTMANRYITLLAFSACRISDAIWLGSKEITPESDDEDFPLWLEWQPTKRHSAFVSIPMLPPLIDAVQGADGTFIVTDDGRPYASTESLRNRVRKWCGEADLQGLSSHGVRKAAGSLLSEAGASQYEIMAIHGHSSARTSEIYTKAAQRRRLARGGFARLKIDW